MLSPRAWGWTAAVRGDAQRPGRCPHARGGGPGDTLSKMPVAQLSPRAWGWTAHKGAYDRAQGVVPTRVGVDLKDRPEQHGLGLSSTTKLPLAGEATLLPGKQKTRRKMDMQ